MQLPQIRYFLALCDEHSFTRAARRSGVSQPSLTNAIRALEEELGGALFQRRPIALTMLGRAVHPYFERMAESADHALAVAQALTDTNGARPEAAIASQFRHDVPR
jgi:DNA-binding transcriptional LysR family regulator